MGSETFTNYWIGQEQVPLNAMPAYVNVVPLAFVDIGPNNNLDFCFLTKNYSPSTIQGWIKEVQQNGTKVLFSINSPQFAQVDPNAFAQNVQQHIEQWGVDGVDIDYEPQDFSQHQANVIAVVNQLRSVLGDGALLTAPIYAPWLNYHDFLREFAIPLNYLTTMDYTPYPGLDQTTSLYNQYAQAIGTASKLGIGVSCMGPQQSQDLTPLDDVVKLCTWEPEGQTKQGIMLYTFSYDKEGRLASPGIYTSTISEHLP
jgi:hypothetical protein